MTSDHEGGGPPGGGEGRERGGEQGDSDARGTDARETDALGTDARRSDAHRSEGRSEGRGSDSRRSDARDGRVEERERQALAAWTSLTPPAGFADRVMAARRPVDRQRHRRPAAVIGAALVGAAAGALLVAWAGRAGSRADAGALPDSAERATAAIGDRAVAVAEAHAQLSWSVNAAGDAELEQASGDVFYRVERGGLFVVHTPAGDVRVTGTCFRVEVDPMNHRKQVVLSGAAGAVLAAAVVVTVYEGRVVAETKTAKTELPAGSRATIAADGQTIVAANESVPALDVQATRDQLLARTQSQRTEIAQLRARLAAMEKKLGRTGDHADTPGDEGRSWHDPSPETLQQWATECHVRIDEPSVDHWQPLQNLGRNERGLEPSEIAAYNAAMSEVVNEWRQTLRALYVEATGDTAGADTLSLEAMRQEIVQKAGTGHDYGLVLQRLSAERAGLAQPPADLSRLPPIERLMRAYARLGDRTEAALASRLGAQRARDIRGDGWGHRSDYSGCPDKN